MKKCACCKNQFPIEKMRRSYCISCKANLEKKNNITRRKWNENNKDKNKEYSDKYFKNQRQNPLRKFQYHCGIGINRAIKHGWYNDKRMENWIGLNVTQFKKYIESLWSEGMDWNNYGKNIGCWSIDHIIPPYNCSNIEEIIKLQHYTNLRPIWHSINIKKRNKIEKNN